MTGLAIAEEDDAKHDYLCDDHECANFVDGLPLYVNETHLSQVGSSMVVEGIIADSTSEALRP